MSNSFADPTSSGAIQIVVNGKPRTVPQGFNLEQLLTFLEVNPSRVAVERNRAIVRKTEWAQTAVNADDQLEIVWFVGGGAS